MARADLVQALEDTPTSTGGVERQHSLGLPQPIPPNGLHTLYETEPEQTYLGLAGRQQWTVNSRGLRLKTYLWPASVEPRAVLVFAHGHGAHSLFELLRPAGAGQVPVYEGSWAEALNKAGISLAALDNQGCGRSEGLRFYTEKFDYLVEDVCQLAGTIREGGIDLPGFAPGLPLFISGISLGGCIAFNAALAHRELFEGALLLAPMLSLERVSRQGFNPYLRPVASLLSLIIPTALLVATDRNVLFPDIQALWDADPLVAHGKTRVRNASEYLRITEASWGRLEEVDFPFIVWHSENDTMCDCDASKQLYLRASSADKTLILVNGMWHVLLREAGNEKVLAQMIEWICKRA